MQLASIVKELEYESVQGDLAKEITGVACDSREVLPGNLFVAISGFTSDGHKYVGEAVKRGAAAVIVEREAVSSDATVTMIQVKNARLALAKVSAHFYQYPSEKLNMIGITGTNGKTSTAYFLQSILEATGKSTGIIGTIGTLINGELLETKNTTPESLQLQQFFSEMEKRGVSDCVMEVSSHAIDLKRTAYTTFHTGVFTNLSPDHLELHKSMDEYFHVKAKLFDQTYGFNVINMDDPYGQKLVEKVRGKEPAVVTYGLNPTADIYASDIDYSFEGTTYMVNTPTGNFKAKVNLPGEIYVYNSLAAAAAAYCSNISFEVIQQGLKNVAGIKGRLETVYSSGDYKVVVDFCHTEDALEKALKTIRPYVKGKLILVFGVYADESESGREKRSGMARVAATYADLSVVTSDNPKHHDPKLIIREISQEMKANGGNYHAFLHRKEAIEYAVRVSNEDDVILIAGKGHETTQIVGDQEIPFNEKEIVMEALRAKEKRVKL
ncbi:UDP-N-acetylmuramoyl-L-alanyl-D-glutamate--2,6-diaminopimelate ligase [Lentibacillus sediminis]|uniref:UDP-N-acetylmuramoyl-L-alanyl-D-glutamate--2, 6-diaminopimelate ligase n=1 Tax=Lentibacillus sediminis TaxID=1940529 RepID=UPI000C1BA442|nr:UDP-N-acetylmuramoyl-L-alanyl-D-glutamate--2,6-diaminopimelate ligase [Lentibacillus sediminis]